MQTGGKYGKLCCRRATDGPHLNKTLPERDLRHTGHSNDVPGIYKQTSTLYSVHWIDSALLFVLYFMHQFFSWYFHWNIYWRYPKLSQHLDEYINAVLCSFIRQTNFVLTATSLHFSDFCLSSIQFPTKFIHDASATISFVPHSCESRQRKSFVIAVNELCELLPRDNSFTKMPFSSLLLVGCYHRSGSVSFA